MSDNERHEDNGLCLADAEKLMSHRGIVAAEVNEAGPSVVLAYNPADISEAEVEEVAREVVPQLHRHFERCTMRLAGRACEACAMKLEARAQKIPGIRHATATFIGGIMSVTFDEATLPADRVLEEVRKTGAPVRTYELPESLSAAKPATLGQWLKHWFTGERLEIVFTAATLVFLSAAFIGEKTGMPQFATHVLFFLAYVTGGFFGVQASWQSLRNATIDVDLLMVLAALGAAYVDHPLEGAMLLFLFSLSNVLQHYAMERTRKAIHALMQLRPDKALVRRDGQTVSLPIDDLVIGDRLIVRPGERVPLDGAVIEGHSTLDESSLTGESMPVSKHVGDSVFAGTINQTGAIEVSVKKLAKDSTIARLIQMVEEAQSEKAETQRWLDRAEQYYAMGVIGFTLALILVPLLMGGGSFDAIFYRAMTVMVVASPCALIISTPASILSAIGGAARRGVLFKGGAHLERTADVKVVVFDKTGTLTEGKPRVTDIFASNEQDALQLAATVEARSEHPLAQAIVAECKRRGIAIDECAGFQSVSGQGASAVVNGQRIGVGNERFFEKFPCTDPQAAVEHMREFQRDGKTAVIVARLDQDKTTAHFLGVIAIADVLRADAPEAVRELRKIGVKRVVMMTGDNRHVAEAIARQAGIDEVHAELRPEEKMALVKSMKQHDVVAMVGDGVNDAPALAAASVGIAMGAAGTDVAMETADVVLMSNNLHNVAFAIGLSRNARRVVYQNLAFAMGVIVVLIASALGLNLPLTLGVIGHEGSTVLVCLNGLRLLMFRGTS